MASPQQEPSTESFRQGLTDHAPTDACADAAAGGPGLFFDEEEERERLEMAPEELYGSEADVYGTHGDPGPAKATAANVSVAHMNFKLGLAAAETEATATATASRSLGSDDSVAEALAELDAAVDKIPRSKKGAYLEALRQCPYELNADRRTAFLRREDFDAAAAAKRLVRYWERKLELFGPERCYVPLTVEQALGEEMATLSGGFYTLLPKKDDAGRAIMAVYTAKRDMSMCTEAYLRGVWYLFHCALEDPETQKRGLIILLNSSGMTFGKFDPKMVSGVLEFEKVYLPIRLRAMHHCYPPKFLRAINPIIKYILGRRLRMRVCVHGGSTRSLLNGLGRYGISPDRLPRDFGGTLEFSPEQWLIDRLAVEQRRVRDAADKLDVLATAVLHAERRDRAECSAPGEADLEEEEVEEQNVRTAKKIRNSTQAHDEFPSFAGKESLSLSVPTAAFSEGMPSPALTFQHRAQSHVVDLHQQSGAAEAAAGDTPSITVASNAGAPLPSVDINASAAGVTAGSSSRVAPAHQALLDVYQQLPVSTEAAAVARRAPSISAVSNAGAPLSTSVGFNVSAANVNAGGSSSATGAQQRALADLYQQLALSETAAAAAAAVAGDALSISAATNAGLSLPIIGVNAGAAGCAGSNGSSATAAQPTVRQALPNAALLQLRRGQTLSLQGPQAASNSLVLGSTLPGSVSDIAAAETSHMGLAGVLVATPLVLSSRLGSAAGPATPAVTGAFSLGASNVATLEQLVALAARLGGTEAPNLGGSQCAQPASSGVNIEALVEALSEGSGAAIHSNRALSPASALAMNTPQMKAALNQFSLQMGAAGSLITPLRQANISAGQSIAPIGPAHLQQETMALQLASSLQQQHVLGPDHLSMNAADSMPQNVVPGRLSTATLRRVPLPCTLYVISDEVKISTYQCLVRRQVEAFVATEEHVHTYARGRCKPILLGQVGIRCRHCKGLPLEHSPRGSIYFPTELVGMYQTAQKMATLHLASDSKTPCPSMPSEVREQFQRLSTKKSRVGGGKHYWADAGRMIGLIDSPNGIWFEGC